MRQLNLHGESIVKILVLKDVANQSFTCNGTLKPTLMLFSASTATIHIITICPISALNLSLIFKQK